MNRLILERYESSYVVESLHPFYDGENFEELVTARFNRLVEIERGMAECELDICCISSTANAEHDDFIYTWVLYDEDEPFSEFVKNV